MDNRHPFEKANNVVIEWYLRHFEKRLKSEESFKFLFLAHLSTIAYILLIIKYSLNLYFSFDYEIKLCLYDVSVLFGGISKYNTIYFDLCLDFRPNTEFEVFI